MGYPLYLSWFSWDPKLSQTVRRLLCQDLLVDFENSLEVHVKVYVRIVYSR